MGRNRFAGRWKKEVPERRMPVSQRRKANVLKMTKEAEDAADRIWREAQAKIQKLIDDQSGLREVSTVFARGSNEL